MRLSVVVVTRNRREDLAECLDSVLAQCSSLDCEIIVVDNASTDGSAAYTEENYPSVRLIRLDTNHGCPGGRNTGIQASTGDAIFFVDDDAVIAADALQIMVRIMTEQPTTGAIVPKIIDYYGGIPKPKIAPDPPPGLSRHLPMFFGTSMIRRQVFDSLGLLPDAFMYGYEELDLSLRMLDAGCRIVYAPTAVVHHKGSPASRDTGWQLSNKLRNSLTVLWKYAPIERLVFGTVFNTLVYLVEACRRGCLRAYGSTLLRLPDHLLRIVLTERKPLSRKSYLLFDVLSRSVVTDWDSLTARFARTNGLHASIASIVTRFSH